MGLDGISVNQLRVTQENNSAELNRASKFSLSDTHKVVDGLSNGQKVDPDRENKHQDQELNKQYVEVDDSEEEEKQEQLEIVKYDLSDNNRYDLKIDEESNKILIIEKQSKKIVQKIDAQEMSEYVGFLASSQGSIVNRKI